MSDFLSSIAGYSAKRLALLANELKQRVDALEAVAREPIAIVGMACRFPGGADTPELYWDLIRAGVDAIVETPSDRWEVDAYFDPDSDSPGKMTSRHGGFLSRVDEFDPDMFGIAHREARHMDPQQRLLLEVAWEALENAGIPAGDLSKESAGIFVGLSSIDYWQILRRNDLVEFDAYAASGVAHSIASGRLAYVLGARGPAISIDTACSSSLVAAHLAVQSLRNRECDVAITGGVNIILAPDTSVALSKARMMAADGRCKAFDASADGFVRGEGCGVLVLKRLADAKASSDPIVAVIRGTACNQDGRSNGLTAPSGAAQEALLNAALKDAGVEARAITYVEAHGTGTKLGDPIEVLALDAALGRDRHDSPLLIGSVKANIGHLEPAAGMAGLIKLALMLRYGVIPRQIHFETPNPHIPWESIAVSVPRCEAAWPVKTGHPRLGGVSSFGFSGTNAHLILEQAPPAVARLSARSSSLHIVTASARSNVALDNVLKNYAAALAEPDVDFGSFARVASAGRTHFPRRAAIVAANARQAAQHLVALRSGEGGLSMHRSTGIPKTPKIAFLFTGQGAHYARMAKGLLETQPVFRAAIERCEEHLKALWPHSLREIIFDDASEQAGLLHDTAFTQPVLFAVEYALFQLWSSWGVRPVAVAGHSLGEISAACAAGMLSLENALKLTTVRGRLMGSLPRNGAMVVVMASEEQVSAAIKPYAATVSIAAINSPTNCVISGEADAVSRIVVDLRAQSITTTPLNVSHAFHSPLMEPILADFLAEVRGIAWQSPQTELISSVTGLTAGVVAARPEYWRDQLRMPVRFADAISTLVQSGCNTFIEIGPHPTLIALAQDCVPANSANWIASLRRGADDILTISNALAALYVAGGDINWSAVDVPFTPGKARLPNYPFQRERFWVSEAREKKSKADWRFKVDWVPTSPIGDEARVTGQNWLVLADADGAGDAMAERLRSAGASVEVISLRNANMSQLEITSAIEMGAPIDRALHGAAVLWPLDAPAEVVDLGQIEAAHAEYITATLYGLRAVVDRAARVIVATRETQSVMVQSSNVVQAPIWSLAGVAALEYPACGLTRIDLCSSSRIEDGNALFAEACTSDGEDRVAYRNGERFVARLTLDREATVENGRSVQLEIGERGSLSNLTLKTLERHSPGPGEVEIRVYATGLGFRDVLNALGQGDAGPLGNECSGVVTAIGPDVTRVTVGEDVVAMVDRSFATHVVAPEMMTVRKPPHITYQEAASVPVAYLTADYALRTLCAIKPGDRVLIHAVTGGVGMAATQIALRAGAVVFGTASTETKREFAKRLGVHRVSNSRSLDFVEEFLCETEGKGFDIVLNSLPGEFIPASLRLVADGGTLVEIGKDIWTPDRVAQQYPGVRYHPLSLGELARVEPTFIRSMLENILAEMDRGRLRPLPQTVFPLGEAERAFRYMSQGLHTGKVVVTQARPAVIRDDGAYVITGGLTGLGLTTAKWLANQGARNLVLIGRRRPSQDALKAIVQIEATGTSVRTAQVDVGDRAALGKLFVMVRESMGPIRGTIHAAGVLDDGMLSEQTPERFARVMAPKVRGGWALHELTATDPLDFFVLFSSGAALLGSPGQSNYAAANGFLDGLAGLRHARGLPALSINWGGWADIGMAAGIGADHHRRWAAMGLEMITAEAGIDMLAQLLASGAGPQVTALPIVRSQLPSNVVPFYHELVETKAKPAEAATFANILVDLRAAGPDGRRRLLDRLLADQVRRVLALPIDHRFDTYEALLDLGMDSLMAVELRNHIQTSVGVRVAVADLLGGASLTDLRKMIMNQLTFDHEPAAAIAGTRDREEVQL